MMLQQIQIIDDLAQRRKGLLFTIWNQNSMGNIDYSNEIGQQEQGLLSLGGHENKY